MEEELSSKDEGENAPNLSAIASNSDHSPVCSNPSIADRTVMEETADYKTKRVFISFDSEERGRQATHDVLIEQSSLSRWSRKMSESLSVPFNHCWIVT